MDDKTISAYNQEAGNYDAETKDFWEKFPRTIIDEFTEAVQGKILDIGSGPGRDGLMLQEKGLEVVCFDASEAMVEFCRIKGLKGVVGDFANLPFADKSFDGVWSYTAWLHVPKTEIDQAIAEACRVLKTGGILGIGMIEGNDELYRVTAKVTMPRWFSFYKKEELEQLLNRYGFKIFYFETFKPNTKNYLNFIAKKL